MCEENNCTLCYVTNELWISTIGGRVEFDWSHPDRKSVGLRRGHRPLPQPTPTWGWTQAGEASLSQRRARPRPRPVHPQTWTLSFLRAETELIYGNYVNGGVTAWPGRLAVTISPWASNQKAALVTLSAHALTWETGWQFKCTYGRRGEQTDRKTEPLHTLHRNRNRLKWTCCFSALGTNTFPHIGLGWLVHVTSGHRYENSFGTVIEDVK